MLNSAAIARPFQVSEMYRDPCGIDGIHLQDQAITESMGPIVDHGWEHLAQSDQMITSTRGRLLMAARALRDQGTMPSGSDDASVYRGARSGYFVSSDTSDWQQVYASQLANGVHPPRLHAAEQGSALRFKTRF